jgi:hypothetical protein
MRSGSRRWHTVLPRDHHGPNLRHKAFNHKILERQTMMIIPPNHHGPEVWRFIRLLRTFAIPEGRRDSLASCCQDPDADKPAGDPAGGVGGVKVGGRNPFALRPLRRICFPETDARRAAPAPLHLAFIAGCPIGMRWQAVAGDRGVAKFCTPARRRSCKTWQELRLWLLSSRTLCLAVCTPARLVPEAPRGARCCRWRFSPTKPGLRKRKRSSPMYAKTG